MTSRNSPLRRLLRAPSVLTSRALTRARQRLGNMLPRAPDGHFSVGEALSFGGRLDQWERYGSVLRAVRQHCDTSRPLRILEAGAGGEGVMNWADREPWLRQSQLTLLDLRPQSLIGSSRPAVAADGSAMPFRDNSFDVALSIDSLEHVPVSVRRKYADELMRVARAVVVHVPAQTENGEFDGRRADAEFFQWYLRRYEREETNTAEHLASEAHPDPHTLFPGATVRGSQPVGLWLRNMKDGNSRWMCHLSGFRYLWTLRTTDINRPPFHAALIVWKKKGHSV